MPYESRHGCTSKYNRCRHDPAHAGIFIHGGTIIGKGRFGPGWANRFSFTTPTKNRRGQEVPDNITLNGGNFPTYQTALAGAKAMRDSNPVLQDCHIYACTDLICETSYSGRCQVQLVSASTK